MGRLQKDVRQILNDTDGIFKSTKGRVLAFESHSGFLDCEALMRGPKDSPYSDGIFTVTIHLPPDYPFNPPIIKFETRIWHPNVDPDNGKIYLDFLMKAWSPAWTLHHTVLAVWSMMDTPILDGAGPYNREAAQEYRMNRMQYRASAQSWTEAYAVNDTTNRHMMIFRLKEMGFGSQVAKSTLERNGWVEEKTLEELLAVVPGFGDKQNPDNSPSGLALKRDKVEQALPSAQNNGSQAMDDDHEAAGMDGTTASSINVGANGGTTNESESDTSSTDACSNASSSSVNGPSEHLDAQAHGGQAQMDADGQVIEVPSSVILAIHDNEFV